MCAAGIAKERMESMIVAIYAFGRSSDLGHIWQIPWVLKLLQPVALQVYLRGFVKAVHYRVEAYLVLGSPLSQPR